MASNPSEPVQEIGDALSAMSGNRANIEVGAAWEWVWVQVQV